MARWGYAGELAVGQQLIELTRNDCWVFHDVMFNKHFNIDHVLVAPNGVFAIETKARSKHLKVSDKNYKVSYDGKGLVWPGSNGFVDYTFIKQARDRTRDFQKWLSKAVGENIPVVPVLSLPGWMVERKGRGDVSVLSHKEIPGLLKARTDFQMNDSLRTRIIHQLDQKVRDVSFQPEDNK